MSDLDSVAKVRFAFLRLTGVEAEDPALVTHGEAEDDVVYVFLTRGTRTAQRWLLKMGYGGWRKRSAALSFSGSDDSDGGRFTTLPSDFLRAWGGFKRGPGRPRSALVRANGDRWGSPIEAETDHWRGNYYYIRGEELWLTRGAQPPTPVFLDYHFRHPVWTASVTIDFPLEVRALIPAEAANVAKEEAWLPGAQDYEVKIARALALAREEARDFARPEKGPRTFRRPFRMGSHY